MECKEREFRSVARAFYEQYQVKILCIWKISDQSHAITARSQCTREIRKLIRMIISWSVSTGFANEHKDKKKDPADRLRRQLCGAGPDIRKNWLPM